VGGFCYISRHDRTPEQVATARQCTRRQFAASGFEFPTLYDTADGVLDVYGKINYPSCDHTVLPDGFAVSAGTLLYRGAVGAEALRRFAESDDPDAALSEADGNFAILLRRGTRTLLLRDQVGAFEVYFDDALGVISTSFLAVARTLQRIRANPQEIYEYVFNGVSLGNTTPVAGIKRLGFGERIVLDAIPAVQRAQRAVRPVAWAGGADGAANAILRHLLRHTAMLGRVFDGHIKLALSGGYDSRFLLALFRRNGISPDLFVYGAADSADVLIARRIANAERLGLQHIDASLLPEVTPDHVPDLVAAKFHREDGLPWSGVFDSAVDLLQRADRHAPGYLHVSGGGGEVFRNYFNLLDRSISLRQFVWLFYSQYDPACARDFDPAAYEDAICGKIADLLGTDTPRLDRRSVDCLYPYLRCRSWFGRENSINGRFGYSVLPFFERRIVEMALAVPVRDKYFGNFEARMIRAADPALAAYPSSYGHNFLADAPILKRLAATTTYARPLTLRRYTYRLKARLAGEPRPAILTRECLRRAVAPNLPRMTRFFRSPERCSNVQFNRIATLEYLYDQLQAE
jgi:hypothetical protein